MKPLPFDVVAAFLRLGEKYSIAVLTTDALTRLKYEYPSTLEARDQSEHDSMIKHPGFLGFWAQNTDVINLARGLRCAQCILPAAFHNAVEINHHRVVLEETRLDGSKVSLCSEDQVIAITGWIKGRELQRETLGWLVGEDDFMESLYDSCTKKPICTSV